MDHARNAPSADLRLRRGVEHLNACGAPPIRLCLLAEARDPDGEPRAALVVPPSPTRYGKHSTTLLFPSLAAAVAAKRAMEEVADAGLLSGSAAA